MNNSGRATFSTSSPYISRTQIIMSEKWADFEKRLSFEVFSGIAKQVANEYWEQMKEVVVANTDNPILIQSIREVKKNDHV